MEDDIKQIHEKIQKESVFVQSLKSEIAKVIVGQDELIEKILVGMFAGGHILLEGVPGLAKTLTIKTLAEAVQVQFKRIQFTPDLLPADLIGTMVFSPKTQEFNVRKGPIFTHLLLADEINRAPAKVQSALLEAMQEKQVTIGDTTHILPPLFLVMATQNPIEQEGTYPLPEAQIDRFMLKLKVQYPSRAEEAKILDRMTAQSLPKVKTVVKPEDILKAREFVKEIYIDDLREEFVRDFVFPMFRANTIYEGEYLLGTSIARPLIAKRLIEIANETGADTPSKQQSHSSCANMAILATRRCFRMRALGSQ